MGFTYYRWVIDHADVSGPDFNTLLILADFANDDGHCWPSIPRIAARARISERSVKRSISDLAERGFLERRGRAKGFQCWLHLPAKCFDGACLACRVAREEATQSLSEEATQSPSPPEEDTQALSVARPSEEKGPLSPGERATQSREGATQSKPPTPPYKEEPTEPTGEPTLLLDSTSSEPNGQLVLADPSQSTAATPRRINGHEFERFWEIYPRKVGKAKAREAFKRACRAASLDAVLAGACEVRRLYDEGRQQMKYIPHPTTWLNRGGWEDETEHVEPQQRATADDRVRGFLDIANSYLQGEVNHAEVRSGGATRHDQRL